MLRNNNKPTNCMESNAHRFVLLTVDKHTHYMVFFSSFRSEQLIQWTSLGRGSRFCHHLFRAQLESLLFLSISTTLHTLGHLSAPFTVNAQIQHTSILRAEVSVTRWVSFHVYSISLRFRKLGLFFGFQVHSTIVLWSRRCEFFHIARHIGVSVEVGNLSTLHAVLISFWYGIYVIQFSFLCVSLDIFSLLFVSTKRFTLIYVSEHLQWCTAVLRLITLFSSRRD